MKLQRKYDRQTKKIETHARLPSFSILEYGLCYFSLGYLELEIFL